MEKALDPLLNGRENRLLKFSVGVWDEFVHTDVLVDQRESIGGAVSEETLRCVLEPLKGLRGQVTSDVLIGYPGDMFRNVKCLEGIVEEFVMGECDGLGKNKVVGC